MNNFLDLISQFKYYTSTLKLNYSAYKIIILNRVSFKCLEKLDSIDRILLFIIMFSFIKLLFFVINGIKNFERF